MPFDSVIHILPFRGKSPKRFSETNNVLSIIKLLMATKGLVKNLFVFCASLFSFQFPPIFFVKQTLLGF